MKKIKLLALLLVSVLSVNVWGAVTALSLPKMWAADDGKSAYTEALGCTLSGLGSDYGSAPKLKFDTEGDYIIIQVADAPDEISFSFKQNGSNAGTFLVEESDAGSNYTTALTVSWPGNSKTSTPSATLKSSTRYIKLRFSSKGSSTNVGLGGISITKATPTEKYTVTIKDGSDNTLSTLTELTAGAGVTLPDQSTICEDWTFLGYSETKFASETQDPATEPTIIDKGSYNPTKNITLYPIFIRTESTSGTPTSYQIIFEKGNNDSGSDAPAIQSGSDYATLSSTTKAYKRTNGMHLSSSSAAGNATLTLTNAGKVKASSIVTNALAKDKKSFKITVTYTDATTAEQSFTPGITSVDNTINLDNTKTISTIYYSASSGTGTGIASTTVNYTNSVTHDFYITTPSCAAPRVLDYIEVTGTPAEFWKGDEFNHDGMIVTAYYTEGDPEVVTNRVGVTFSTPDMTTVGEQTITVSYKEKTATYTIDVKTIANTQATAYTAAEAIAKYKAGKDLKSFVYVKGIVSEIVTEYSSQYGNISFNVSADGQTTSDQFQFYRNFKGADKAKWTSADEAPQVGDEVIGYGTLTAYGETYEFAEGNYIVSLTRPKKLTSITISRDPAQETIFDTETSFDHKGISVIAHYNTGASDDADVTGSAEFTAPDMTTTGEKTVNVSYTENEITKETSYKINVGSHCNTPVTISKGTPEHGSFTLSAEGNQCADGLVVTVTPNAAEHYHFKQITATNGDVDDNAKTVSNITANTTINVEFEEDEKVTVKWHVGTAAPVETANVYVGTAFADVKAKAPIVADNAAGDCADKFMGWATSAITAQDGVDEEDVAWATEPISNENKEFYAVWAKQGGSPITWTKMAASEISESGTYALITSSGNAFTGSISSGRGAYTTGTFSFTNNVASTAPDGTLELELTAYEDEGDYLFDIYNSTYGYLYIKAASEGNLAWSKNALSEDDFWIYDNTDENFEFWHNIENNPYYASLRVNSGTFRTYSYTSTTGSIIAFAKKNGGLSYSNYITSCFIPTYSVTIQSNNTTMGTVTVDPEITAGTTYEAGTEFAVMAEPTDDQVYRFAGWSMTPNNTGATLDDATSAVVTFTVGTGDVTLTANFEAIPADPITVTLEVGEHGTLDCEDCVNNTITEETAGDGVLVPDVTASEGWAFLGWCTSSTATEAQYKPADADIFYPSDDNKTLYAVYAQLYKVTLKYTDEVKWQTTAGGAIALPTDRNCKNETYKDHFAGWSETEFAEETTNPTETPTIYKGSITPTEDIILYPVFSVTAETTQWVKTTGDKVTEGVYAILCSSEKAFNGSTTSGHGGTTTDAFVFDANNIATSVPTGICEIRMQPYKNAQGTVLGYKMYNEDKGYLYAKEAKSGSLAWQTTENSDWCWASDNWKYFDNSAYLRSYSGTAFRTYSGNSGDAAVHFAKKETASVGKYWSKPANDVTNPELDTPAGDYLSPLTVKITEDSYDIDLIYYYTTDGSTPAAIDLEPQGTTQEYDPETGIVLEPAKTYNLQVIGYDDDGYTSQIAKAEYVLYPVFNSISAMYAGFQNGKPVGLTLTDAYIHKVYTPGGGTTKQLFVQEKNNTLGVVLSGNTSDFGEDFNSGIEGKTISFTVTGEYALGNERKQIGKVKFTNYTINDVVTRPTAEEYATATIAANLIGLTKLDNVYAIAKDGNVVTVNTQSDGLGDSYKVYNIFNVVSTIPECMVACNVKGLFNVRDGQQYIMPVLATDFDVVEKQNATLPDVKPAGGASEGAALPVAQDEIITITPVAGFTTSYKINDAAEWTEITTQKVQPTITAENTKIEVKATRPYYNDASATYFYHIDAGLTKYPITLPYPQTYVKTETDLASAKAGDKVTITISQNQARYWETSVTVVKTGDESFTTDVTPEGNHKYSFIMPAYPVTVKVNYADAPKVDINYNKGDHTGIEGEMPQEHAYVGDEYTLKDCAFHAAGLTFVGWKAYKTGDKEMPVAINDNKIIVPEYNVSVKAQWDEAAWRKEGTWELIEDASDLEVGDYVILASSVNATAIGTFNVPDNGKSYYSPVDVTKSDDKKKITDRKTALVMHVEAGTKENTFAFRIEDNSKYIAAISSADNIIGNIDTKTDEASWSVTNKEAGVSYSIVAQGTYTKNLLKEYTSGSARITCYGSTSSGVTELAIYKFYPKAWTVTFDDNVEDEEIKVPVMQRADHITNKVTISTDVPVRTGYDFSIWNSAKGGTGVISAEPGDEITLSQNATLYAQWSIKQYNVAVAEVENVTINAKPYGEADITEGTNADVNFKKSVVLTYELNEDYVFKSWKVTKADEPSVEVPISVGSSTTFEVPAYAVTVSAVIESKATTQLTVTYHANGGVNKTPEGPEEVSEQVNWNTTIKFSEHPCPFEKNLCTFVGWNTKADGSGTTYKTQVTVKTDIDLYAMWQASAVEYVLDNKVEAKVSVKDGLAPEGSSAAYTTDYSTLGQLTNGKYGTLTLTGFAGKVITGVKMEMKTNKSGGAGTIVVKVGDTEICSTSYSESFGGYSQSYIVNDLQNFVPTIVNENEDITIKTVSSDNSLYINGYTIEYEDIPEETTVRSGLTPGQYTTYCEPQTVLAGTYTGATFWNIVSKTTMDDERLSSITIVQHDGALVAGVPYIMLPEANELTGKKCSKTVAEPAAENAHNGLVGVFETTMFGSVESDEEAIERGIYVISNGTLYLCGNNCGVYANRAYILNSAIEDKSATTPPAAPRRVIGNPNGTPTNFNGLNGNVKAQKALIDGHIYILRDNKMYNAQGLFVK